MKKKIDKYWMKYAIKFAEENILNKEIPIGAVLIYKNKIIGTGFNSTIKKNDPTAHAEIIALRKGANLIKNYRLLNTTLYVTIQPCMMCFGAILHSRIKRLVFGSFSKKYFKNCEICKNFILKKNIFNKIIIKKIIFKKCSLLLKKFFKKKR
ncbi:tRNA adenosine(34) deaminase TadA [Buchnera aphidicola (Greenidea ficicola)]